MAESLTIPMTRVVETVEEVPVEMWQLAITRGTDTQPGEIVALFRPLDETGEWDETVPPLRKVFADDLTAEHPAQQRAATMMRQLLIGAIVPPVTPDLQAADPELVEAILTLEAATGQTLQGKSVREVGELLLPLGS